MTRLANISFSGRETSGGLRRPRVKKFFVRIHTILLPRCVAGVELSHEEVCRPVIGVGFSPPTFRTNFWSRRDSHRSGRTDQDYRSQHTARNSGDHGDYQSASTTSGRDATAIWWIPLSAPTFSHPHTARSTDAFHVHDSGLYVCPTDVRAPDTRFHDNYHATCGGFHDARTHGFWTLTGKNQFSFENRRFFYKRRFLRFPARVML